MSARSRGPPLGMPAKESSRWTVALGEDAVGQVRGELEGGLVAEERAPDLEELSLGDVAGVAVAHRRLPRA